MQRPGAGNHFTHPSVVSSASLHLYKVSINHTIRKNSTKDRFILKASAARAEKRSAVI
jgi:hypothetical protein